MKMTEFVPLMSKHQAQKGRSLRFLPSAPALPSTSQLQCSVRLLSFPVSAHGSGAGETSGLIVEMLSLLMTATNCTHE